MTSGSAVAEKRWRRALMDVRPLRQRSFRRLWLTTVVTALGSQLTAVAVPKQLYDDTGSSAFVGLAGAFALVPLVIFALWGGAVADAVDRRKLLIVTNSGIAVTSALLWAQAVVGSTSPWIVLVLLAAQQAFFGLNFPARSASIPRLVPPELLPAALAMNSTTFGLGAVIGPLLAGTLIPVFGISLLYLIDTLALGLTVFTMWRLPAMPPLEGAPRRAGLRDVVDGFRYLATRSVLLVSFLADLIAMILGMPRALFPEMAERAYTGVSSGFALGLLYAAIPAGSLIGGFLSGTFSRMKRQGRAVVVAVVVWGLAITAFGLTGSIVVAALMLAIAGAADLVSMVFRGAILQTAATDAMRGRLQGVFAVVVAGGPRLADMLHGFGGALIGTKATVVAGGLAVVVVMGIVTLLTPAFWRYEGPDPT